MTADQFKELSPSLKINYLFEVIIENMHAVAAQTTGPNHNFFLDQAATLAKLRELVAIEVKGLREQNKLFALPTIKRNEPPTGNN